MNIDDIYPSLNDLKKRAKQRLPFFAWEYLDSATGVEDQKTRNKNTEYQKIHRPGPTLDQLVPKMCPRLDPQKKTRNLSHSYFEL